MEELDIFHNSSLIMYSEKEYYDAVEKILQHGQSVKKFQLFSTCNNRRFSWKN